MSNYQPSLPGWETVRLIGSGSSGNVYEIKKKDEYGGDFHCALKVITVPSTQKEYDDMVSTMSEFSMRAKLREKVEEISQEYRLLGALRGHPNIVNCEDQMIIPHEDDLGWDIYIRMELLQSLPDYVRENGMTIENVIKLGEDMCSALMLCRENHIIHRDIKPQNIFVSRYGVFKLGDFGVAKASVIHSSGDKVGTYSYMAPEVYKGKGYDDRVDTYSLGMVLYWLLNERRGPFLPMPPQMPTPEQIGEAQMRRFRGEPLPMPKNGGTALKSVVMKACSYKPSDRYDSPKDMREALELAALGKTVQAPATAPPESEDMTVKEDFSALASKPRYIPEAEVRPQQQTQQPRPKAPPKQQARTAPPPQKKQEPEKNKSSAGYIVALVLIIVAIIAAIVVFAVVGIGRKNSNNNADPVQSAEPTATATPTIPPLEVTSVMLSSPNLTMITGEDAQLSVTCVPEPSEGQTAPQYIWKSSDDGIVTVSQDGKLTAVRAGSATIMVYVKDKMDVYDQCVVTVEDPRVTELVIEQMPVKTVYTMDEELDTTGLVLRAYYNDGSAKRISDPSEYTVECDMSGLGNRDATVTYDGATVTYTVRVSLFG